MACWCCVPGCKNSGGIKDNLRFHSFPVTNESLLNLWLRAVNRSNWMPTKNSKICSDHFLKTDYSGKSLRLLKPDAVPSQLLPCPCLVPEPSISLTHDISSSTSFAVDKEEFDIDPLNDEIKEIIDTNISADENHYNIDCAPGIMPQCVAIGCEERTDKQDIHSDITFHRFPKDIELKKKWLQAIRREHWEPVIHSCICSLHFEEEDLDKSSPFRTYLKKGAVPSIFPAFRKHLQTFKEEKTSKLKDPLDDSQAQEEEEEISNKLRYRKMVHCCAALDCRETTDIRSPGVIFHSFPLEPDRIQKWVEAMNRPTYTPSKNAKICSKHFEKSCYIGNGNRLRNDACPTLFQFPNLLLIKNHLQDKIQGDGTMETIDSEPAVASTSTPGYTSGAGNTNQLPKLVVSPFYTNLSATSLQNIFPASSGIPVTLTQNVFDPLLLQSAVQPSEEVPCITVVSVEKIIGAAKADPPIPIPVPSAAISAPSSAISAPSATISAPSAATAKPATSKQEAAESDDEIKAVSDPEDTDSIPLDRRRDQQITDSKAMMKQFKVKLGNYRKKIKAMQQKNRRLVKTVTKLLNVLDGLKSNKKALTDEMLGSATHFLLES